MIILFDSYRVNFVKLVDEMDNGKLSWEDFSIRIKSLHENRTAAPHPRVAGPTPKHEENFYANPFPGCICEKS